MTISDMAASPTITPAVLEPLFPPWEEPAARSGFDFIDFWAVDFDWKPGMPCNHHWQDYRTRKDRTLVTVSDAGFVYPKRGKYTACVKVVDTFGCDTSITVDVTV